MNLNLSTIIRGILILTLLSALRVNAQENRVHYITDSIKSFDSLLGKFKGSIVYVDIWASWCQPCQQELRDKKAIKAFDIFGSKHNIVVLYICADKDESKWKAVINQNKLTGYHIWLNPALRQDIFGRFSFYENRAGVIKKGFYIPRHLIIDQLGMVADSMADHQNSVLLYTRLQTLLNKH
jgi:thiol-disulfide isomerase/thioredoxin